MIAATMRIFVVIFLVQAVDLLCSLSKFSQKIVLLSFLSNCLMHRQGFVEVLVRTDLAIKSSCLVS